MHNKTWSHCEANGGLESLAAEASRRTEKYENEGDLEPQTGADTKGERKNEQEKEQKTKIRKAYTITKQRERWTDGEHERFLQALKRYGRAWRKIEEHIGTKTAVQIRSHAQKFFSKLQREQSINGSAGEESSKAGICIPPPRPKRKPAYPYPKKSKGMETDQSCELETEKEAPSAPTQPSSAPSFMQMPPSLVSPQSKESEPSLSQVLESAAAAAARAWSQVVANAGTKVQHQLQAHVAAQQEMHAFLGANPQAMNPSMMCDPQTRQPKAHTYGQTMAKFSQPSSQYLRGQHQGPQDSSHYGSGRLKPSTAQSAQGSPNDNGTTATHNDRDSASSKEPAMQQSLSMGRASTLTPYQSVHSCWAVPGAPALEARLGRAAWHLMAQAHAQPGIAQFPGQPTLSKSRPSRTPSAGVETNTWTSSKQQRQGSISRPQPILARDRLASPPCFQDRSDTSQLAQFYQQAAAEDNGTDNGENGSSGAEGRSGSGGGSTTGAKRSAKGSNHDNNCGSDDGQANGSDNGGNENRTRSPNEGKGSEDRSESPAEPTCNSTKASQSPKHKQQPLSHLHPLMLEHGAHLGVPSMASGASSSLQQHALSPQALQGAHQLQILSQQQQLASYQQQALSAWAATASAQGTPTGYHMMQNLMGNMQNGCAGTFLNDLANHAAAASKDTPANTLKKQSSEMPSMEAFPGNVHAHSIPAFNAPQSGGRRSSEHVAQQQGESQSGFKPYSKKHGMPISSLPPSKRFAAGTINDKAPSGGRTLTSLYTPFGSSKVQTAPQKAAGTATVIA